MDMTDIARWQFAIITVYHFLFVPITIGLSAIVAGYETAWLRTGHERWLRLTKFFGKLFLINFAIGVVTGIVQEFQFGMNWSDYSRFVGDIFGAPLAVEGLLAFFLESTFLGLWIFGWDRLPPKLHAACIWLVHLGTLFSAYFILAANSWMQHPVGYEYNPDTGRAEMNDFAAVLFNKVQLVTFPHVVLSAYMTGAAFVIGVAVLAPAAGDRTPGEDRACTAGRPHRRRRACWSPGSASRSPVTSQGKVMTEVQPMKMAAAEALYDTESLGRLLAAHHRQPGRVGGEVLDQGPRPAVLPRHRPHRRQRSRGSTSCATSTGRSTARTPARRTTRPATTHRSSPSRTGRSAS